MATANYAAWLIGPKKDLEVKQTPYESPGPKDVIIKSRALAINPVDWQMQDTGMFIEQYPTIFGVDVAGTVHEVGSEVTTFTVGDRVIGNAPCLSLGMQYAAFRTLVRCPSNVVCKLPDEISFEQGGVLPLAINTASHGLFSSGILGLPKPQPSLGHAAKASDAAVLIYSGSTAVGSAAIQLAKAAGVMVVTTASADNFAYCRELGADHVFDYKEASWIQNAAEVLKGKKIHGAFDCISHEGSTKAVVEALHAAGVDGPVATVTPPPAGLDGHLVFGTSVTQDEDLAKAIWAEFLPAALAEGTIKPKPEPLITGKGLESIQKGLDTQRAGVRAKKVVVTL